VHTLGRVADVCVSALETAGTELVTHNAKLAEGHSGKDGAWEIHPQGQTKTIKNELNPVFDEDFVLTAVSATKDSPYAFLFRPTVMS